MHRLVTVNQTTHLRGCLSLLATIAAAAAAAVRVARGRRVRRRASTVAVVRAPIGVGVVV